MKLTIKALAQAVQRLSVQIGVVGSTLTGVAASLASAGVPGAAKVAVAGAVLTGAGMVIGAVVPQKSVATYNPATHDLTPKQPAPLDPSAGSEQ